MSLHDTGPALRLGLTDRRPVWLRRGGRRFDHNDHFFASLDDHDALAQRNVFEATVV